MKKKLILTTILLLGATYLAHSFYIKNNGCFVGLGGENFNVTLAQTPEQQQQGLSGTLPLAKNEGKLFVFDHPDMYGIWMKDMNYAIDIIWFDGQMNIVGISKNIAPNTYPKVFYPNQNATYTLEVPSGTADRLDLNFGSRARLSCKSLHM